MIQMKLLLILTAVFEVATGFALLAAPAMTVSILLGAELETPAGSIAGRIAGAALVALAIMCWQARNGERYGVATGVVAGMFFYNVATALIVAYAGLGLGLHSALMWPVLVMHAALAVWCAAVLLPRQRLDGAAD